QEAVGGSVSPAACPTAYCLLARGIWLSVISCRKPISRSSSSRDAAGSRPETQRAASVAPRRADGAKFRGSGGEPGKCDSGVHVEVAEQVQHLEVIGGGGPGPPARGRPREGRVGLGAQLVQHGGELQGALGGQRFEVRGRVHGRHSLQGMGTFWGGLARAATDNTRARPSVFRSLGVNARRPGRCGPPGYTIEGRTWPRRVPLAVWRPNG